MYSWERPIEDVLLDYVKHMASTMEEVDAHNREEGWFANNELADGAKNMARAYRTVQHKIETEIKFRKQDKT